MQLAHGNIRVNTLLGFMEELLSARYLSNTVLLNPIIELGIIIFTTFWIRVLRSKEFIWLPNIVRTSKYLQSTLINLLSIQTHFLKENKRSYRRFIKSLSFVFLVNSFILISLIHILHNLALLQTYSFLGFRLHFYYLWYSL